MSVLDPKFLPLVQGEEILEEETKILGISVRHFLGGTSWFQDRDTHPKFNMT